MRRVALKHLCADWGFPLGVYGRVVCGIKRKRAEMVHTVKETNCPKCRKLAMKRVWAAIAKRGGKL